MPTDKDYVDFVKEEINKMSKTKFSDIDDGSYVAMSSAKDKNLSPKDVWYLLTIIFLNNPNNSKYVKLLILILDIPEISIYKKCQKYYEMYTRNEKQDYPLYKDLDITSFKYDTKVYPLLSELIRRLIVIKKENNYYINPDLFTVNVYMRRYVMGKDTELINKMTNEGNIPTLIMGDCFDSNPFNADFVPNPDAERVCVSGC